MGLLSKIYDISVPIIIVIVTICGVVGWLSSKRFGNENIIEEASEEVIKDVSGIDVDLTPQSPERPSVKLLDN